VPWQLPRCGKTAGASRSDRPRRWRSRWDRQPSRTRWPCNRSWVGQRVHRSVQKTGFGRIGFAQRSILYGDD